jgi:hypothetical protein
MVLICGLLAGCGGGAVTVPSEPVLTEVPPVAVPQAGIASTAGGDGFTSTIASAIDEGATPAATPLAGSADGTGRALDDDRINLMQWTLEQQKIDAAIAEQDFAKARSQLVVVQPTSVPSEAGVNVALFAQRTSNAVGERVYQRGARVAGLGACGRYRDADAAQRAFLAAGGPESDRLGLDPDGDGFACAWNPAPYRALN